MKYLNKKIAVIGLGIEGRDLLRYLHKKGVRPTLLDSKNESELDFENIDREEIDVICGENYLKSVSVFDIVFRSAGVNPFKKKLVEAQKSGTIISSAIREFFNECPAQVIGVTGTKGKGTTSTLTYEILKKSGKEVYLAGNIGKPYLELLPKLKENSWVILELSSFQLIDLEKSPHISVVLNITTDHLDWHKDRAEYVNAKKSIVSYQKESDFKVLNADYIDSLSFSKIGKAKQYYFSRKKKVKGAFVKDGDIVLSTDIPQIVGKTHDLLLRGEHNWENVTAAITAASLAGASLSTIKDVVFSFKGLEHRLELVRVYKGMSFYNDSFATGPETVLAAANSFTEPCTLILGGFDKGLNYGDMAQQLAERKNVNIILIGDIAGQIENDLRNAKFSGTIENIGKPSMQEIVKVACSLTPPKGVVVLSPGTSSFDMFDSYKDRGNKFREAVLSL